MLVMNLLTVLIKICMLAAWSGLQVRSGQNSRQGCKQCDKWVEGLKYVGETYQ